MKEIRQSLAHFAQAIRETNQSLIPFLMAHKAELFGIFLGCELLDQFFKSLGIQIQAAGGQSLAVPLGRLNVALLLFVLLTMLIPLRDMQDRGIHGPMGLFKFSLVHLKSFTLESLRVLAWVLLLLPLLIIPGLIKYVQYLLVPYIVLTDPEYQAGKLDALQESARLMKGLVSLFLFITLLSLPLMMWTGQFTEPILITQTPLPWLLSFVISSGLYFYFNLLLYKLYIVRKRVLGQGETNESHIQS